MRSFYADIFVPFASFFRGKSAFSRSFARCNGVSKREEEIKRALGRLKVLDAALHGLIGVDESVVREEEYFTAFTNLHGCEDGIESIR